MFSFQGASLNRFFKRLSEASNLLDVSVQAVPLIYLFYSVYDTFRWVSPFGNLRIEAYLQLPEAYRSLSRPSSAPDAKAFPLRSY